MSHSKEEQRTFSLLCHKVSASCSQAVRERGCTYQYKQPLLRRSLVSGAYSEQDVTRLTCSGLRLGAFGGAFRVYMSILRCASGNEGHHACTTIRRYDIQPVVDPASRRHQDSTTNLYTRDELLMCSQSGRWPLSVSV